MGTNEKLQVLYTTKESIIVTALFFKTRYAAVPKIMWKLKLDGQELSMAKILVENLIPSRQNQKYLLNIPRKYQLM